MALPNIEGALKETPPLDRAGLEAFLEEATLSVDNSVLLRLHRDSPREQMKLSLVNGWMKLTYTAQVPARTVEMNVPDHEIPAFVALFANPERADAVSSSTGRWNLLAFLSSADSMLEASVDGEPEFDPDVAINTIVTELKGRIFVPDFNEMRSYGRNSTGCSVGVTLEGRAGVPVHVGAPSGEPPFFACGLASVPLDRPELVREAKALLERVAALREVQGNATDKSFQKVMDAL